MRRGVIATINEIELMAAFGGYLHLQAAPKEMVLRVTLALQGKGEAAAEQARELENTTKGASSGSASGGGGRTTVSRSG